MATETIITYDAQGTPTTTIVTVADELAREERIGDKLDQRVTQLAAALTTIDTQQTALTAAQIRTVLRLLVVTVLGLVRLLRRRFDAAEE